MNEDAILRATLGHRASVPPLLALLPKDATAGLDPRRLRPLAVDHVGRGGRRRGGDIAWAVGAPTEDDPDAEALLVVECQSRPERHMALRMLVYAGLLWQTALDAPRPPRQLPLPLLVVVYTGGRPWRRRTLRDLLRRSPQGLRRRSPQLDFEPLDAGALSADDGRSNWVAALLRLLRCREAQRLPSLSKTLFDGLRREGLADLATRLADLLMRMLYRRFADSDQDPHGDHLREALRYMEEPTMLEEAITEWRQAALDEGHSKGLAKGRSEGLREGERTLLRRLAARRFGAAVGDALAALLADEQDAERLAELGDLVLDCESAEELLRQGRIALATRV